MTTMIERMAMAIYAKNAAAALGRQPWAKAQEATKEGVRDLARAALEEMLEPTEGMKDGQAAAVSASDYGALRYEIPDEEIQRIYAAMIDAALKEES